MEFNTLEDIDKGLPDEGSARKWLCEIRWGKWASCPYCGNGKAYFIENGKRYKCANKLCYKKFSVTVKTLMEASNIELGKWVKSVWIYATNLGNVCVWDIEKLIGANSITAGNIKDKIDFCWKFVHSDRPSVKEIMMDIFQSMFNLYEKKQDLRRDYILNECDNITDIVQYRKVVKYTQYWLRRATWLKDCQFSPEDLIAETFLYLHANGIKEYNAELIAFLIRKTSGTMHREWLKEHPNSEIYWKNYRATWHRNNIRNLGRWYIVQKLKRSHPDMKTSQINAMADLITERRKKIIDFRKKYKVLYDFNSHFS